MKAAFIYMASGFGSRFGGNKTVGRTGGKAPLPSRTGYVEKGGGPDSSGEGLADPAHCGQPVPGDSGGSRQGRASGGLQSGERPGITASIAYGTRAAEGTDIFLYFVADQPRLRPETTAGFLKAFADSGKTMGCLAWNGRRGNPAAFRSCWRPELLSLQGDKGGRQLMARYPDEVWLYPASEEELWDVDHREDLEKNAGEGNAGWQQNRRMIFSRGSVVKNILKLALPMTLAQLINVMYNIVDRLYIGLIPENATLALTGLGLCLPIISIVTAFANLFRNGRGASVFHRAWEKETWKKRKKLWEIPL